MERWAVRDDLGTLIRLGIIEPPGNLKDDNPAESLIFSKLGFRHEFFSALSDPSDKRIEQGRIPRLLVLGFVRS